MFVFDRAEFSADGRPFGTAGETNITVTSTTKAFYGQHHFPVAIDSGTKKMTVVATAVAIDRASVSWLKSETGDDGVARVSFTAALFAKDPATGKNFSVEMFNCVATADDLISGESPSLEFECYADSSGRVCQFYFAD